MSLQSSDYKAKLQSIRANAARLFKAAPEPMKAFQSLILATTKEGALSATARCEGCIIHHVDAAARHSATREELVEAICVAVEMGGGPSSVYGATALAVFDEIAS